MSSMLRTVAPPVTTALAGFVAVAALALSPPAAGPVAALFAPWLSGDEVLHRVAAADAAIVRWGALDSVVVVGSERPDLSNRLRAAGAWLVVDPVAIAGCLLPGA